MISGTYSRPLGRPLLGTPFDVSIVRFLSMRCSYASWLYRMTKIWVSMHSRRALGGKGGTNRPIRHILPHGGSDGAVTVPCRIAEQIAAVLLACLPLVTFRGSRICGTTQGTIPAKRRQCINVRRETNGAEKG